MLLQVQFSGHDGSDLPAGLRLAGLPLPRGGGRRHQPETAPRTQGQGRQVQPVSSPEGLGDAGGLLSDHNTGEVLRQVRCCQLPRAPSTIFV